MIFESLGLPMERSKVECFSNSVILLKGKLQAMPLQVGQRHLEQTALVLRHLVLHLLLEVRDDPDGTRHLPVKWVAPLL